MANRVKCASNLRYIGYAISMYADARGGQFPDRLEDLLSNGIDLSPEVFVCPSSKDTPATAPTTQQWAAKLSADTSPTSTSAKD